jgi:hypothetical protein
MACKINWAPPALNDYVRVLTPSINPNKKFAQSDFCPHICIAMTKQIQNIQWWWHTNLNRGL